MKTKDIVLGLIIIILLVTGVLVYKNSKKKNLTVTATPNYQKVESKFPSLKVPTNADRASLNDVTGGGGEGEAFKTFSNGKYSLTVMADLPTPKAGDFYQAWIVKDSTYFSIGKMTVTKGGYISEFGSNKDYSDYSKVLVTEEKVFNQVPETHVLEGSF